MSQPVFLHGVSSVSMMTPKCRSVRKLARAFTTRVSSWQAPAVFISYDEGRSFDYSLTGPYETTNAFLTGDNEFVVYTVPSNRSDSTAGIYR